MVVRRENEAKKTPKSSLTVKNASFPSFALFGVLYCIVCICIVGLVWYPFVLYVSLQECQQLANTSTAPSAFRLRLRSHPHGLLLVVLPSSTYVQYVLDKTRGKYKASRASSYRIRAVCLVYSNLLRSVVYINARQLCGCFGSIQITIPH